MYTKILIKVLLTGLYLHQLILCTGQEQIIQLKIVIQDKKPARCADTSATVLEGEPMKIQVDYDKHITNRSCSYRTRSSKVTLPLDDEDLIRNVTEIQNVTADMGALWNCTFWSLPSDKKPDMEPSDKIGDTYYIVVSCNIKIHVRRKSAPQVVLVNGVVLPTERAPRSERAYDARALHRYSAGDELRFTCANVKGGTCTFPMVEYTGDAAFNLTSKTINNDRNNDVYPVGFHMRMGSEHHDTHLICECKLSTDYSRVAVFFQMYTRIEEYPNIFINNVFLKPKVVNKTRFEFIYEYLIKHDLRMRIPSDMTCNDEAGQPVAKSEYQLGTGSKKGGRKEFTCTYCKNRESLQIKLQGTEKPLINRPETNCWMDAELSQSSTVLNASLALYKDRKRYLLYEHKDDTSLFTMVCTAGCDGVLLDMDLLGSDGASKPNPSPQRYEGRIVITRHVTKPDILNDNIFECKLRESKAVSTDGNKFLTSTILVFAPYQSPTTTSSRTPTTTTTMANVSSETSTQETVTGNQTSLSNGPIIGAIVAAIGIILIIIIVIYKLKKRRNNKEDPQVQETEVDYENLKHNDSPIPAYPPQWESHYNVPADNFEDSTYSEPCTGVKIKPVLYSVPVSKKRRQKNNIQNSKGIYRDPYEKVVIDRPKNNHEPPEDVNYAEIIPEGSKKQIDFMYGQVLPKAQRGRNPEGTDYANVEHEEPNYAQPVPTSKYSLRSVGSNKYANVADKKYINAKKNSDYTEPAYCEVNYTKRK